MSRVVVLGASTNPERTSYQAVADLLAAGHEVIPVNPKGDPVHGLPTLTELSQVEGPVDGLSLYIAPKHQEAVLPAIIALQPPVVIANPGTESEASADALRAAGIRVQEACTLVLLRIDRLEQVLAGTEA